MCIHNLTRYLLSSFYANKINISIGMFVKTSRFSPFNEFLRVFYLVYWCYLDEISFSGQIENKSSCYLQIINKGYSEDICDCFCLWMLIQNSNYQLIVLSWYVYCMCTCISACITFKETLYCASTNTRPILNICFRLTA